MMRSTAGAKAQMNLRPYGTTRSRALIPSAARACSVSMAVQSNEQEFFVRFRACSRPFSFLDKENSMTQSVSRDMTFS